MRTVTIEHENLKSILLNHKYPDGNVTFLMACTEMACLSHGVTLRVDLPSDHWAFKQTEEPKRFEADSHKVIDRETKETICVFTSQMPCTDAGIYAEMLNNRWRYNNR